MTSPVDLLETWLQQRVPPAAWTWFLERRTAVQGGDERALYLAFGLVPRKTGKSDLQLTPAELSVADQACPGWNPASWSVDQAARAALVLAFPSADATHYVQVLDRLFATGEVHELAALYAALPLYPHPEAFRLRCAEGIRTNIRSVLTAIAHHNPYPAAQLADEAWNQLILKCLFVGLPLDPVVGVDRRANPVLARILSDFAEERGAAGRSISPELWRCVGPYVDVSLLPRLQEVLRSGTELEKQAVMLALQASALPAAQELAAATRSTLPANFTWQTIASQLAN